MSDTESFCAGAVQECVGYCEECGVVDHHLIYGECPRCREKYTTVDARLGAEADVSRVDMGSAA